MDPLVPSEELSSGVFTTGSGSFESFFPGHFIIGTPGDEPDALPPVFFVGVFAEDTIVRELHTGVGALTPHDELLMVGERVRDRKVVDVFAPYNGVVVVLNVAVNEVVRANVPTFVMKLNIPKMGAGNKSEGDRLAQLAGLKEQRLDGK